MSTQIYRLLDSKAVLFGRYNTFNLKKLRRIIDFSNSDNGRAVLRILAKPSHNIIPDAVSIIDTLYSIWDQLSKNQKYGIVITLGVVIITSVAGIFTYFYKKYKSNYLDDNSDYDINPDRHDFNDFNRPNFKVLVDREFSTIDKIHLQNCTVSEAEVRELISGLISKNHVRLEKPIKLEYANNHYVKSMPDNEFGNLSLLSNSSSVVHQINGANMDVEESKKGSVKSKNSVFSSVSEYKKKNEQRVTKYNNLKKKLMEYEEKIRKDKEDYEEKIRKDKEENEKLKIELMRIRNGNSGSNIIANQFNESNGNVNELERITQISFEIKNDLRKYSK